MTDAPPPLTEEKREQIDALRMLEISLESEALDAALARLDYLEDEVERVRDWLEAYMLSPAELEVERLRKALARYGRHHSGCEAGSRDLFPGPCTCGLTAALQEDEG